jgi:TonB family protein
MILLSENTYPRKTIAMKFIEFCIALPLILLHAPLVYAQEVTMPKLGEVDKLPNENADTNCRPEDSGNSNPERNTPSQGVNTEPNIDFGPYMAKLKRNVRRKWIAPESTNSRRTVLKFTVARDGSISKLCVARSSASRATDQAALDAVSQAAPFDPLPDTSRKDNIEITFTFDVNVFGGEVTHF